MMPQTLPVQLLVHCRWLLPIAPQNTLLEHQTIAVSEGKIIAIGPSTQLTQIYTAQETVSLNDHVVLPGLVNAHTHASMNLFRGVADDVAFVEWLNNNILPAEQIVCNEAAIEAGSQLAIAEMLRTGTTCFNDHYFFPQITAKIAKATGIRAALGLQIYNADNQWAKDADTAIDKGLAIYEAAKPDDLISWMLAPHAPYTVTDDNFKRIARISTEKKLPVHIHLCESLAENQGSLQQYGKRPIARLMDLGLLNNRLLAVHMVQVNEEEIALLAQQGVHIVHCPESNLKLANGFAPITQYQKAGINVALGTDGVASNNDLDMLGEARTASLVAKALTQNPEALSAFSLLEMMTLNGAKALGLADKIGSLEPGKAADFIAVDLSDNLTQPVYNPASHLIYCAAKTQVSDVWINGRRCLKQFELTTLDPHQLKRISREWQPKILAAIQQGNRVKAI